jgi:hypothetical protein
MVPFGSSLLAASGGIPWHPGAHDRSLLGWLISAAYLAAALICVRAFVRARGRADQPLAQVWAGLSAVLLLLGANKQLDLQTYLIHVLGRGVAMSYGFYPYRRVIQFGFMVALLAATSASMAAAFYWLKPYLARIWLAGLGVGLLAAFVLARAAFFNHVGGDRPAHALFWHIAFELTGIACIGANAYRDLRDPSRRPSL